MRTYRCPECRTRRSTLALLKAHMVASGHRVCNCGHVSYGGTGFPHRPGTPYCDSNPLSAMWQAQREGADAGALREIAEYINTSNPSAADAARGFIDKYVN